MIRLVRLAFSALPLALVPLVHAQSPGQFSLYADVTVQQISGVGSSPVLNTLSPLPCSGTSITTPCTAYNDSVHPVGFTAGASYDFKTIGLITLGADARAVVEKDNRGAQRDAVGSGTRMYSGLGGIRASFKTPYPFARPYVQGSFGYARSNYGVLTNAAHSDTNPPTFPANPVLPGISTQNNLEYHFYAGLDLHVLSFADWRVFEAGYGGMRSFGTYAHTYPLYSISSGLVIRFPARQ